MKFSIDPEHRYAIHSYGPGQVVIGAETFTAAVILSADHPPVVWSPQTPDELRAEHFESLLELDPEIVLLGCGERLRFPPAGLSRCLMDRQVGLEVMNTPAACRTYNILLGEGRRVVAALMML